LAGLLGFDRDDFLEERDPARQDLNTALLIAAAKIRQRWAEEMGHHVARALWGD
jgi:hypothetical protein